jgi:hypothetical protein
MPSKTLFFVRRTQFFSHALITAIVAPWKDKFGLQKFLLGMLTSADTQCHRDMMKAERDGQR